MQSPLLWMLVPAKDEDAWLDFLGSHERVHDVLAKAAGRPFLRYDDLRDNLLRHEQEHNALADFFAVARPGDLSSADLRDPESFATWMYSHAVSHAQLATAVGI